MIVDDQKAAIALLSDPATFGLDGPVEHVETHISRIFLTGNRAYKLKRAVKLPYVDFSTPELRLAACEKEVELNSATAPGLYLGVRRIARAPDGALTLDGDGETVDAAIEMRRFDQADLLDGMAEAGLLTPTLMTEVARMVVRFHRASPVVHKGGGAANIGGVLDINEAGFATSHLFAAEKTDALSKRFRTALERHAALLDGREAAGRVRRCHGDLHLRNICMIDGAPRLFDCIEFNDAIATVDVLYDLAFLLMDLWHRNLPQLANLVANRYLDEADDEDGFVLLPFLMAVRAAVRAHVTATQIEEGGADSALAAEARSYFALAGMLLERHPARLVAIGGLSGTGKTTIAEALAPHLGSPPGARIIESDRIRKAMHDVPPETRLPDKAYRPEVSEKVYREVAWRSRLILSEGGCAVADAVFDKPENRERIAHAAAERGVPFTGIWLEADPTVLWQRVGARRGGVSDATLDILSRQLERRSEQTQWLSVDAARRPAEVVADILAAASVRASSRDDAT